MSSIAGAAQILGRAPDQELAEPQAALALKPVAQELRPHRDADHLAELFFRALDLVTPGAEHAQRAQQLRQPAGPRKDRAQRLPGGEWRVLAQPAAMKAQGVGSDCDETGGNPIDPCEQHAQHALIHVGAVAHLAHEAAAETGHGPVVEQLHVQLGDGVQSWLVVWQDIGQLESDRDGAAPCLCGGVHTRRIFLKRSPCRDSPTSSTFCGTA